MNDLPWHFLVEVVIRTLIMFILILVTLAISGKRSLRQLSVFELVLVIGLGSAAGDPMFYHDVGLLPAVVVLLVVIALYQLVIYLTNTFKPFERLLEGKTVCLIKDGMFETANFKKEHWAQDEFFAELRIKGVSQLGQIKAAYIETNGSISVFYFQDEEVKPGLPILPELFDERFSIIKETGLYACTFCGNTEELVHGQSQICPSCAYRKATWAKACFDKRVK